MVLFCYIFSPFFLSFLFSWWCCTMEEDTLPTTGPATRSVEVIFNPESKKGKSSHVGSALNTTPASFTSDGRYFFLCSDNVVKVNHFRTGELFCVLNSHKRTVTSCVENPLSQNQVYSASLDGTIILWDLVKGTPIKCFDLGLSITDFFVHPTEPYQLSLSFKTEQEGKSKDSKKEHRKPSKKFSGGVASFDIKTSSLTILFEHKHQLNHLQVSNDGVWLAVSSKAKFFVYNLKSSKLRKLAHKDTITALAFHPQSLFMALGDHHGRILLWYCLHDQHSSADGGPSSDAPDKSVFSVLHWHSGPVRSLCFTIEGQYMLSGGLEGVLVQWQLATGHRRFLPRLGAAVVAISCAPTGLTLALVLADNSVKLIDSATFSPVLSVEGLTKSLPKSQVVRRNGLVLDPVFGHLVVNGGPGALQFYDVVNDRHVRHLQVAPVPPIIQSSEKDVQSAHVELVAFSPTGEDFVTVDARPNTFKSGGHTLRFWNRRPDGSFVQMTTVDMAHKSPISSLLYHPTKPYVITVGRDSYFKVWEKVSEGSQGRWVCRSTATFRSYTPTCACFSRDGTVLAIAYGQVITFWDIEATQLLYTLSYPPPSDPFTTLAFFAGPYLLAATARFVLCWNVLSRAIEWAYALPRHGLVTDIASPTPAAGATTTDHLAVCLSLPLSAEEKAKAGEGKQLEAWAKGAVLVFTPTSSAPQLALTLPGKEVPLAAGFKDEDILLCLSRHGHTYAFSVHSGEPISLLAAEQPTASGGETQDYFKQLFGEQLQENATDTPLLASAESDDFALPNPCVAASPLLTCRPFLASLVGPRVNLDENERREGESVGAEPMEEGEGEEGKDGTTTLVGEGEEESYLAAQQRVETALAHPERLLLPNRPQCDVLTEVLRA
eukprot:GCRY01001487.1.p1 GENE.GCRY01001487.1~~GCRY01001487.1.p1  ORF type:complete len:887 (-),score=253.42 GCRY01001487.1:150-2810(-)